MASDNPYRRPESIPNSEEFYAEELTRLPFVAIYKAIASQASGLIAVPMAAFLKVRGLLNKPLASQYATGPVGTGQPIEPGQLPAAARRPLRAMVRELEEIGFRLIGFERDNIIGAKQQFSALLLDADETTLAHLEWMRLPAANGTTQEFVVEFDSFASEDPEIMTGRVNPAHIALADFIVPDFIDHLFMGRNVDVEDVLDRHVDRIESRRLERIRPEAARARYHQCAARRFAAVREAGLLRPLSVAEVALLRQHRKYP